MYTPGEPGVEVIGAGTAQVNGSRADVHAMVPPPGGRRGAAAGESSNFPQP